ncbi:hypothetical protein F4814DRAFT_138469 [Daldinia grandis]|nr:hypothetical protein F4814DRAFT_138469 [Daldinia grandis]
MSDGRKSFKAPIEPDLQPQHNPHHGSHEDDPVISDPVISDLVISDHVPVLGLSRFSCIECNTSFPRQAALNDHTFISQHNPCACSCGKSFSRSDALNRHCNSFRKADCSYPCKFCKHHRDRQGFRRRDHLVQHLGGYHKFDQEKIDRNCPEPKRRLGSPWCYQILVCPYAGCEHYRGELKAFAWSRTITNIPFTNELGYRKHLKDVHGDTPFHCHVAGCDRVGRRGYIRERDLIKHLTSQHPDAAKYSPAPRTKKTVYECGDCEERLSDVEELYLHYSSHCRGTT